MSAVIWTADNYTTPVLFEHVAITTETRFKPDTDEEEEQYRNVLRVVLLTRIDNLKSMSSVDAGIVTASSLTGSFKGGDQFTITPGLNFPDLRLVSQEFAGIEQEGSKLALTRTEWVSMAFDGQWQDIDWS